MIRPALPIFFLLLAACAKSDAKPPPKSTFVCGTGPHAIVCKLGAICGHASGSNVPVMSDPPPRGDSGKGESCGGVAGYHCGDGLDCEMPADQANVADGMGTCVAAWKCLPPGQLPVLYSK